MLCNLIPNCKLLKNSILAKYFENFTHKNLVGDEKQQVPYVFHAVTVECECEFSGRVRILI